MTTSTQQDRILDLFKTGFMGSKQEIRNKLGIENVGGRISELKNDRAERIHKVMSYGKNRFGEKVHYALYFMEVPGVRRIF